MPAPGIFAAFTFEHTGARHCDPVMNGEANRPPPESPSEPSDDEMADQFAALAVDVVLHEMAEMPVLLALANKRWADPRILRSAAAAP